MEAPGYAPGQCERASVRPGRVHADTSLALLFRNSKTQVVGGVSEHRWRKTVMEVLLFLDEGARHHVSPLASLGVAAALVPAKGDRADHYLHDFSSFLPLIHDN